MHVQPLTGRIGAIIDDLDLESIDDAGFHALSNALLAHQVVFLRDQDLSDAGHRALAHRFGTPTVYPLVKHFGGTEYLSHIEDDAERPPDADGWHMDITWTPNPPKVAILFAEVIPPSGGDTMWADLYGAWEQLSPTMQAMLRPLEVRHAPGTDFWDAVQRNGVDDTAELQQTFPGAVHPLVREHPVTGKTLLNLSGYFMESVVGLHPDESTWLLERLMTGIDNPNLQVRWRWAPGDVAIWDEPSTVHRALSDHYPQHRRMRRCTVDP